MLDGTTMNSPPPPHNSPDAPESPAHLLHARTHQVQIVLTVLGIALMLLWCWFWLHTLRTGRLALAEHLRIPAWSFLGFDFLHNYWAVRLWVSGGNPYLDAFGDWRGKYAYPPVVLLLYLWSALFSRGVAVVLWMGYISAAMTAAVWIAGRTRSVLGLMRLPLVLMLGLMLWSMPVLFATERGQGDAICLLLILVAALAYQRPKSWAADAVIGACIALAAWVKVYPAVLILGLLAMRAWRPFALSILMAALIGIIPYRATMQFVTASMAAQQDRVGFLSEVYQWLFHPSQHRPAQLTLYPTIGVDSHSLTTYWGSFWTYTEAASLQRMPGVIGAAIILGPPTLWLSVRMLRASDRARAALAFPYLLWLAAMATFIMPVSYDYNLFYLPLAALAVCDRRDPLIVGLALIALVAWCQPFKVPVPNASDLLFFLKLFSLLGIGVSLLARGRELDRATLSDAGNAERLSTIAAAA
ncbi:MAG TPA: glycosyltransferase family 87 protein [Tepidisphaeraceae bacterium]|nr:glycosyltransferase family 87 protein [Tepidisphaeraceae bacterium]